MAVFSFPPPDQFTPVDSESFRQWFYRLYQAVKDLANVPTAAAATSCCVRYFIGPAEKMIVPLNVQELFAMTIDNEGILEVNGYLILVD